jgi:hypothetical protein
LWAAVFIVSEHSFFHSMGEGTAGGISALVESAFYPCRLAIRENRR